MTLIDTATEGDAGFVTNRRSFQVAHFTNPIHFIEYNAGVYGDDLYSRYSIQKPANFNTWRLPRRAQFFAGRLAAKQALRASEELVEDSGKQILIGRYREPLWPSNIIGSLSHSNQYSIATVKPKASNKSGIGLDIQSLIDTDTQNAISSSILTQQDSVLLNKAIEDLPKSLLFTIIFSAKESFFKAVFNIVGDYFGFDAVTVVAVDMDSSCLTLKTETNLGLLMPKGFALNVAFTTLNLPDTQIITLCDWEL